MTLSATAPVNLPVPPVRLPAELLDMIGEALLSQADEATRGAIAARLVREIHEVLAWFHSDPFHREGASFQRVVDEAEAHQARLGGGHGPNLCEPHVEARPLYHSNFCDRLVYGHRSCNCPRGDDNDRPEVDPTEPRVARRRAKTARLGTNGPGSDSSARTRA
jgi:hypothetical protein